MTKYYSFFIILLCSVIFSNCSSENNCVIDMQFERIEEEPGPDLITFTIISNDDLFKRDIEKIEVIEVYFNEKKTFKSLLFAIKKTERNKYELKVSSPYFSIIEYLNKEKIYELFRQSDKLEIKLKSNNDIVTLTKCINCSY
jgi:hypothetical protein